jgi:hypothetical protein
MRHPKMEAELHWRDVGHAPRLALKMKVKKDPAKKSGKVLGSYQKVGTKFVPPMLQAFQFDQIRWSNHTMPELVWWDVIADKVSHRFAVKVAEEIAPYLRGTDNRDHWWAFISDYNDLSDDGARELRAHLAKTNVLPQLTESLTDFLNLYPGCPISKLLDWRPIKGRGMEYSSRRRPFI